MSPIRRISSCMGALPLWLWLASTASLKPKHRGKTLCESASQTPQASYLTRSLAAPPQAERPFAIFGGVQPQRQLDGLVQNLQPEGRAEAAEALESESRPQPERMVGAGGDEDRRAPA
eukprot:CAMPEP_0198528626 /NCGR_PEP_ID=MMETSP1462-20131121/25266_1 /TAXON_ID=1333877 /ORGANISM="Brandtodinium nutriculum, Strain RCC3387" /LENGTH=117 /DNA_ID=CAMNT_0044258451 /DNA_START=23 /DNA_END=374 /DNA_ORIENTATION=+